MPCTADGCDPETGCTAEPLEGDCEDGSVCTVGDTCVEGACVPGELNACNDGSSCTDDTCDPVMGCVHTTSDNPCCSGAFNFCDDANPCTTDLCDVDTGECFYEPFDGGCNDGNQCTVADACQDGVCTGAPKDCDDGDPCTVDSCQGNGTCFAVPVPDGSPCDDGLECSTGDQCVGGTCEADLAGCFCEPEFDPSVSKVSAMKIGDDGMAGNALDVDDDAGTCAPSGGCSGGFDNEIAKLASFVNPDFEASVQDGSLLFGFEHHGFEGPGVPYDLAFYVLDLATPGCDVQSAGCSYTAPPNLITEDCEPLIKLGGAVVSGSTLTAGGPGTVVPLSLSLGAEPLELTIYGTSVEATVTVSDGEVTAMTGILGGAIKVSELKASIEALPDESLPIDKSLILGLLDSILVQDIDTDGDGAADAASVGMPFETVPASITGVSPEE